MLHLTTGANGAGKTLNTLRWVRDLQLKENRPVCHNGRFEPVPGGELASWKKIDFKDWQAEPDGTIFLIDECHNDLPIRPASAAVPDPIKMLAEHRRRGMDFFLITQHPQNIDSFVRRLIGSPGWHRHLKRTFGADMVSVLEWPAVNPQCEKNGSGSTGTVTTKLFPKEVYGWYNSASLHTGKKKIPKSVWILGTCIVVIPTLFYFGFNRLLPKTDEKAATTMTAGHGLPGQIGVQAPGVVVKTAAEYVAEHQPRIAGLVHTAPRYDSITTPTRVPVPAACITMKSKGCRCYTQQGTILPEVPKDLCENVVKGGFFLDFEPNGQHASQAQPQTVQNTPQAPKEPGPVVMDIEVPKDRPGPYASVSSVAAAYR